MSRFVRRNAVPGRAATQGKGTMIGRKFDFRSWRDDAMTQAASSVASHASSASGGIVEFRKAPAPANAWDPYEVWLTRVKRPRDARDGK